MPKVYARVNENGYVIAVNSDRFLEKITGWTLIDEGAGMRYIHAQANYLPKPILTDEGAYRYKLVNGLITERTPDEILGDFVMDDEPSLSERVDELEEALNLILSGVTV